jgi:hypothetical protein
MEWEDAFPLTHVNEKVVIQFIEQHLIIRFYIPFILVFYNFSYFYSTLLTKFSLDKGIIIRYSANYYTQGNEVAESTNKNLVRILFVLFSSMCEQKVSTYMPSWALLVMTAVCKEVRKKQ